MSLFKKQVLYKGFFEGTVIGELKETRFGYYAIKTIFLFKLKEKLEGVPEELLVGFRGLPYLRVGDEIIISGEIVAKTLTDKEIEKFGGKPYVLQGNEVIINQSVMEKTLSKFSPKIPYIYCYATNIFNKTLRFPFSF